MDEIILEKIHNDLTETTLTVGGSIKGKKESISDGRISIDGVIIHGLTAGSLKSINEQPDGNIVEVKCIAPNKFEVWA